MAVRQWRQRMRAGTQIAGLSHRARGRLAVCVALAAVAVAALIVRVGTTGLGAQLVVSAQGAGSGSDVARQYRKQHPPAPWGSKLRLAPAVAGRPPALYAVAAFLIDPQRELIYYEKDANVARSMASTTKVMTLLLAVEAGNLDRIVTVGQDAAALVNGDNSYMGLSAGEQVTLRDLLYGLVLPSGNDAAVAIADAIGGSVDSFVALMNQRAQQLGLTQTRFVSPDGLDDGNHMSARDLAVLTAVALLQHPEIAQITSTLHYIIPRTATHKAYELWSGNDLLSGARSPYPGAIGVKPGFTDAARYCQAFAARRHGHLIVGVVLGDWSWEERISDMRALLDWGFAQEGVPPAPPPVPFSPISPEV
jgi:serine-type D-Ala-D-Ala carboxypeptidase (penicillin-binding protein 5/6)